MNIFLEILSEVVHLLREILTPDEYAKALEKCSKTIAYIPLKLPADHNRRVEVVKKIVDLLPDDVACRIKFDTDDIPFFKDSLLIPVDGAIAIPTRSDDRLSRDISIFGTPVEVHNKKHEKYKGKMSISECLYETLQIRQFKIAPAIDRGLSLGKLTQEEYDYIKKFIYKMYRLMTCYLGIKKGSIDIDDPEPLMPSITNIVSNKRIDQSIKHLISV